MDIYQLRGYEVNGFLFSTALFAFLFTDEKIDLRLEKMDAKMDARMDKMDARMDKMDAKMDARMDKMDAKMDRMFVVTTFVSVVSAVAAALGVVFNVK